MEPLTGGECWELYTLIKHDMQAAHTSVQKQDVADAKYRLEFVLNAFADFKTRCGRKDIE